MPERRSEERGMGGMIAMIIVIIIVAGVAIGGYFFIAKNKAEDTKNAAFIPNADKYYAVFLSNGQAYFGKLKSVDSDFAILEEVHYLKVNQVLQPIDPSDEEATPQEAESELQLIKLGGEIHAPENRMDLNMDHVLFFEELQDSSEVVQTIKNQ